MIIDVQIPQETIKIELCHIFEYRNDVRVPFLHPKGSPVGPEPTTSQNKPASLPKMSSPRNSICIHLFLWKRKTQLRLSLISSSDSLGLVFDDSEELVKTTATTIVN